MLEKIKTIGYITLIALISVIIAKLIGMDGNSIYLTLILFYIGVLATFIVIGNNLQVAQLQKQFEMQKAETDKKIKELDDLMNFLYKEHERTTYIGNAKFRLDFLKSNFNSGVKHFNARLDYIKQLTNILELCLSCKHYNSTELFDKILLFGTYLFKIIEEYPTYTGNVDEMKNPHETKERLDDCLNTNSPFFSEKHKADLKKIKELFDEYFCNLYDKENRIRAYTKQD